MVNAALKNPHAVVVLALAILVIGLTAVSRLPTDILPTFKTPAVQILTFYPGMPAEVMEKDITTRLERWTGQANGVARQESKSMVGVSVVKDSFREDVDPNTAMAQVTSLILEQETGPQPQASAQDEERFEVGKETGWFHRVRHGYEGLLHRAFRFRGLVLDGTAVLFVASLYLFTLMGTELFPQTDAGQFMVKARGPTGLRVERSEQLIAEVEKAIAESIPEEDRKIIISNIGVLLDWPAAYTPNSGPQDAFVLVQLTEDHERSTFDYVDELRDTLPARFPFALRRSV